MLRVVASSAFCVFLASCATDSIHTKTQADSLPLNQRAYLLGTFVVSCESTGDKCTQRFNVIAAEYKKIDGTASNEIKSLQGSIFSKDTEFDFVDHESGQKGFYFCVALPPGDYAFQSYRLSSFAGGGTEFGPRSSENFVVPFTLSAGEARHIGRIKISLLPQKGRSFFDVLQSGHVALSGESPQARALALAKCPIDSSGLAQRYMPLQAGGITNRRVQQY